MKVENIKKSHLKMLRKQVEEIYRFKYSWADDVLFETMVQSHLNKIVDEINEDDYLKELSEQED